MTNIKNLTTRTWCVVLIFVIFFLWTKVTSLKMLVLSSKMILNDFISPFPKEKKYEVITNPLIFAPSQINEIAQGRLYNGSYRWIQCTRFCFYFCIFQKQSVYILFKIINKFTAGHCNYRFIGILFPSSLKDGRHHWCFDCVPFHIVLRQ